MGRRKEFDPDLALERATDLFWTKGFTGTSMQDLVQHMGINRGSLYDTFGGKRALFDAAYEKYCEGPVAALLAKIGRPGSAQEIIRGVLQDEVDWLLAEDALQGCLVTNCAVELAPHDAEVAAKVARSLGQLEDAFHDLLVREGHPGNPRALARFLVSNVQGLVVLSRLKPHRATLMDVVEVILSVL